MTASPADLEDFERYVNARRYAGAAAAVAVTGENLRLIEQEQPPITSVEGRAYWGWENKSLTVTDLYFLVPHHAVTAATRATAVSHLFDPPTSSPFQMIDKRRSEAEKVSDLIELIRSSNELPFANRLATRLEELVNIALEETPDQSEMSSSSLRTLVRLLKDHTDLSEPGVVLTPSGNILAEWRKAPNKLCAAEFLGDARVHFVVFAPDSRDPRKTTRISGIALPVEGFMSAVEPHGASAWMRR